jgi:hypothetical protein
LSKNVMDQIITGLIYHVCTNSLFEALMRDLIYIMNPKNFYFWHTYDAITTH